MGLLVWIAVLVFRRAWPAICHYGLSFVVTRPGTRSPNNFGAADFIFGTVVSSAVALLIATPLAVAIAVYLTELAPRAVRRPVGILVELLAAIPSVVLGLWGILVLGPFLGNTLEPALNVCSAGFRCSAAHPRPTACSTRH